MKPVVNLEALINDIQQTIKAPRPIHLHDLTVRDVELPSQLMVAASNEAGYYKRFRDVMAGAEAHLGLRSDREYLFRTVDHHGRQVLIGNACFGGFMVYPKLRSETGGLAASASGIPSTIFGNVGVGPYSSAYVQMVVKYHNTLTDVNVTGPDFYHAASQVIEALRDGKNDRVFWPSSQAYRRLMNLAVAVRDNDYLPAVAVINELFAAGLTDVMDRGSWNTVVEYLATPTSTCHGLVNPMHKLLRTVYGAGLKSYTDLFSIDTEHQVAQAVYH